MRRSIPAFILAALVLGGCSTARLQTPSGFATHDDDTYDYRASDGEGVVLAVRTEKNDPKGDLDFWSSAVDVKLRRAGYEAKTLRDVTSANGRSGRQIRYEVESGGRILAFWVTVFVTGRRVVIVEAGGDTELFEPKAKSVEAAIASLDVG
ncbi:hypothetical protein [Paraliomyxa miuraensis]|uniref:hypothetical protein n=1 Tax=Paraliomyxa miuraensis TaxID=376150 RepID=UPI002253059C|nr:hypothetical protein [Paraliomyxa miuraensis]MCX4247336.1 hypothetical protein [Paraliomyxa miuraensis]